MGACPSLPNVVPAEVPAPVCAGCRVCGKSMTTTAPLGFCCRVVAGQLGLPLVPLGAWSEYRVGDRAHHRLRAYKAAPSVEVRERCIAELVRVLDGWAAGPGARLALTRG